MGVCYQYPLCYYLICVYGCVLSFLMSLFDLYVWVCVISIPDVIVLLLVDLVCMGLLLHFLIFVFDLCLLLSCH